MCLNLSEYKIVRSSKKRPQKRKRNHFQAARAISSKQRGVAGTSAKEDAAKPQQANRANPDKIPATLTSTHYNHSDQELLPPSYDNPVKHPTTIPDLHRQSLRQGEGKPRKAQAPSAVD